MFFHGYHFTFSSGTPLPSSNFSASNGVLTILECYRQGKINLSMKARDCSFDLLEQTTALFVGQCGFCFYMKCCGNLKSTCPKNNGPFHINIGKSQAIRSMHGPHNMIYPLQGLHNLAYDNVNPAMVNGYDTMRSTFATLRIISEMLNMKRSIEIVVVSAHTARH